MCSISRSKVCNSSLLSSLLFSFVSLVFISVVPPVPASALTLSTESGGGSILPQGFSAVDMHAYPWAKQIAFAGLGVGEFPHVEKWMKGVAGRASLKEAYERVEKGTEM